jgi:hypothetical protein
LVPPPKPVGDEGNAMATAAQPELARGGPGPAPPPQDREVALGHGETAAAGTDSNGAEDNGGTVDASAAWAAGPATGAWSFEAEELDDQGSDAPFGAAPVWEGGYEEPGIEEGQGWYEPGNGGWDGDEATAGPTGWYSEELYQDEYPTGYVRSHREAAAAYQDYGTAVIPRTWDEGQAVAPDQPMRRANGPWPELAMIAAVAVIIAAVILAVTSADKANQNASQTSLTSVPTTAARAGATGPSTKAPPSTAAPSTVPSTAPSTVPSTTAPKVTTTAPPSHAVNLPAAPSVKMSLIRSWLATNPGGVGLQLKDVGGTVPEQVFYGEQKQTHVYWALAAFQPSQLILAEQSTAAGQADLAQFQGTEYVFNWRAGPTWTELGYVSTGACPGLYVPPSVLAVWGLCGLVSPVG